MEIRSSSLRRTSRLVLLISVLSILSIPAAASTFVVQQDGSGDFLSIGEAFAVAADGDSILIGPGTYVESLSTDRVLHVSSLAGPELTVLDGNHSLQILEYTDGGGTLSGLTFTHGSFGHGAALHLDYGELLVTDCVFDDNSASYQGGAISIANFAFLEVRDCEFRSNFAQEHSGAAVVILGSRALFDSCTFIDNHCSVFAGALAANSSVLDVTDCLFVHNTTGDVAGAIYLVEGTGSITGNTFYGSSSPGHATVLIHESQQTEVERNIFCGETDGYALEYLSCSGAHGCNLFWNNQSGDILNDDLEPDEIVGDPLFCNADGGVFGIYDVSPAAPEHSPCGQLIGALPVQCNMTAIRSSSWGAVKALY